MEKHNDPVEPEVGSEGVQLDLIKQWRLNLECLKNDVGVGTIPKASSEEQLSSILEGIDYLDRTNKLLDENHDFLLSDSGFLKYKTQHMLVFDYLSQSVKSSDADNNSRFYFVSRGKHIEQQQKKTSWVHSLVHFLFIPIVILVFVVASWWTVKQTQDNSVVMLILFWFYFLHLKAGSQLLKPFKNTAATPFRFRVSLLGIHSLATLLKVGLVCIIPVIATIYFKPYWVDDVIIISLSILCFFHYRPNNNVIVKPVSIDSSEKESSHA